jgi:CheY-like chemotaxis protein
VLLVDDIEDTRDALSAILTPAGFEMTTAWSGEHALRQLRDGLRPCVVLLDLRMPGLDGWNVWEQMRADADPGVANVPVIVMSGDGEQRRRAQSLGIRDFITKPVEFEELIAAVRRYCDERPH